MTMKILKKIKILPKYKWNSHRILSTTIKSTDIFIGSTLCIYIYNTNVMATVIDEKFGLDKVKDDKRKEIVIKRRFTVQWMKDPELDATMPTESEFWITADDKILGFTYLSIDFKSSQFKQDQMAKSKSDSLSLGTNHGQQKIRNMMLYRAYLPIGEIKLQVTEQGDMISYIIQF